MMMKKLTPRQLEVLKLLALPGNKAIWQSPAGNYISSGHWYLAHSDKRRICTNQIKILENHGFVRNIEWLREPIITISSKGEKYLEENC